MSMYTLINDQDIDELVEEHLRNFPRCGVAMLQGHLYVQGIVIQRERVRMVPKRFHGNSQQVLPSQMNLLSSWSKLFMACGWPSQTY